MLSFASFAAIGAGKGKVDSPLQASRFSMGEMKIQNGSHLDIMVLALGFTKWASSQTYVSDAKPVAVVQEPALGSSCFNHTRVWSVAHTLYPVT